ncbi:response regulator receiver domain-containing protein [Sphingobacterium allocomposti]|uniref:Response regulator receiver domain-containing protein n=1 Tax=Sphingobacterium allocomposti TaxID=415956 RepID=A0A5S5D4U9_9SPHI|nr:response regulator [Sphingobacterium composti Yoo et al. 2007 non Ten et al. 2007]TYP90961.1 response regulator receiver domain-containing protein [Sphingobacterium composti Yoo et al. 2007 non Ten et al. 2007]
MEKSKLVLIIDDDSRNIFALRLALKSRGYESVSCMTAVEGIALLQERSDIGVVLMDMMMPEMDGYEAMEVIGKTEGCSHIPVVAVTAQAMSGDREKCLNAGAYAYISKPVDIDELVGVIESIK